MTSNRAEDRLLTNSKREALIVTCTWLAAMVWTLSISAWKGYGQSGTELKFVWGFPDWVFWGIVVPWVLCVVAGIVFSYRYMTDDDINAGALADGDAEETAGV